MSHSSQAHRRSLPAAIPQPPRAPPLPAPAARPLQRARDVASRFLGYSSRAPSPQGREEDERFTHGSSAFKRSSSIGETQDATTSHKTGLEVKTLSINDSGSHAIIAGKEIFKTIRVQDGHCAEDFNIRSAIRSTPTHASGQPRKIYSIDIADVAWAKGESGDYVAAATSSGKIIVYDLGHAGLQAAQLHEHYRQVHNITFNPHRGSLLLSGSQDGTVRLWDLRDLRNPHRQVGTIHSKRKFSGLSDGVRDVKWSPVEGYDFAFGTDNGDVQHWDMRKMEKPKLRLPAHSLACNTVDWHPDGKHILSAGSDRTVRVFDVSTGRPKKASWEIKTAFPVMHARWRPSCQSSMPQDQGAQQCTQIVTAYGKEQPIMHIWDFRRPLLPFRELRQPYDSAPADLLWHSQDLLWTVGGGVKGLFLQTDVQHSPKVIDRCNMQAFDVSSSGELSFFTQSRHIRRMPKPHQVPASPMRSSSSLSTSPDSGLLGRSWADDALDHSFLRTVPSKHKGRSSSNSRSHSAANASLYNHRQSATIKLDDILLNRKSVRPQQVACRGQLPMQYNDPEIIAFMAERLATQIASNFDDENFLEEVENAFKINEDSAHIAGLLTTAQTWKIVGHCTVTHLKDRIALKRKYATSRVSAPRAALKTSIENLATRLAAQHMNSPTHSPGTMRPVSTIARQLAATETSSNVPTPLARPSSRGNPHSGLNQQALPDPDKDEEIVLPPSLASTHTSPPPEHEQGAFPSGRRLTVGNLNDLQMLESIRDYHDHQDHHDKVKRWNTQPKAPLSLDPVDADGVKIPLSRFDQYGSGESFQFLEESTGSRGSSFPASLDSSGSPTLKMPTAHPTRPSLPEAPTAFTKIAEGPDTISNAFQSMFFEGSGTLANSAVATKENSNNTSLEASIEDLRATNKVVEATDFAFRGVLAADPKGTEPAFVERAASDGRSGHSKGEELYRFRGNNVFKKHHDVQHEVSSQAIKSIVPHVEALSPVDSVIEEAETDLELKKPWTLIEMLQQLLRYYTGEEPYAQMAATLILLLGPLLPRTHTLSVPEMQHTVSSYVDYFMSGLNWDPNDIPSLIKQAFEQPMKAGLQPLQVESILSTYHEQLLAGRLFNETAMLRKLAYPAYPAVYEDFIKDNAVRLVCGECAKPMRKNATNARCERCRHQQMGCPICWEQSSPYDSPGGSHLSTSCILCGHGGHTACLEEWFASFKGDGCPTEGCLCDCVPGPWRDKKAGHAEEDTKKKGREWVRRDEWKVAESGAVEGARLLV